ncbi:MAG: hypothetical protein WCS27_11950 [Victivallaceae bacterium]
MKAQKNQIQALNGDDLDAIIGGNFNQDFINKNNLKMLQGKSGAQGLMIRMGGSSKGDSFSSDFAMQGPASERTIRNHMKDKNISSLDIQDKNGKWLTFSRDQITQGLLA